MRKGLLGLHPSLQDYQLLLETGNVVIIISCVPTGEPSGLQWIVGSLAPHRQPWLILVGYKTKQKDTIVTKTFLRKRGGIGRCGKEIRGQRVRVIRMFI